MGQKYESVNKGYCKGAADNLENCFSFSFSPEGYSFWAAVHKRLMLLAKGANIDEPVAVLADQTRMLIAETERLYRRVDALQGEISSQTETINDLRKKLLIADFVGMAGNRRGDSF